MPFVKGLDVLYNALKVSYTSIGRWRHKNRNLALEVFQNVRNWPHESCVVPNTSYGFTIDIVTNSIRVMGIRVTDYILPVLHCLALR